MLREVDHDIDQEIFTNLNEDGTALEKPLKPRPHHTSEELRQVKIQEKYNSVREYYGTKEKLVYSAKLAKKQRVLQSLLGFLNKMNRLGLYIEDVGFSL